jgi:glycosyltransferase involved in cell wall biosynthesis
MRIGIDARWFGPRVGGGGLGRYVAELVNHLQEIDGNNEYVIFLKKENFHEFVLKRPNFSKRLVDVPWYSAAEQFVMPREIALSKVNFMHYPHWNVPVMSRVPFVVTIHDLILLDDPHSARSTTRGAFVHGVKYAAFRLCLEKAVHSSRHIIAISEATKRSILSHFNVSPQKITVIHNGVSMPGSGKGISLRGLGVMEPYLLYVGNNYPHKNLETLLEAFAAFLPGHPETQLVFAGKYDEFSRRLEALALKLAIPKTSLRFLNLPTDEELGALYRNARLLVFPSRLEGFGIPPLEALSVGTPVMASNTSSMPEVLGETVRYVDPDDSEDMASVMSDAMDRSDLWKTLSKKGIEHAKGFSWEKAAKQTLETYLLHGPRRL